VTQLGRGETHRFISSTASCNTINPGSSTAAPPRAQGGKHTIPLTPPPGPLLSSNITITSSCRYATPSQSRWSSTLAAAAEEKPKMYTTSFAFFEALWDAGVTHVFVNLGSDHPSIIEAMVKGAREKKGQFPRIITCPNEVRSPALPCNSVPIFSVPVIRETKRE
jgi:hypothetical protein